MSKKISFCSLMAVLGTLSLLASSMIPTNTIFFFLFSTLFTYICTAEYGIKYGILTFAAITLVSFIILPNKVIVGLYAVVAGYYPVVKQFVEHRDIKAPFKWVLKIAFAFVVCAIAYFLFKKFIVVKMPIAIIFVFVLAVFVLYDVMLKLGIRFYALKLRKYKK